MDEHPNKRKHLYTIIDHTQWVFAISVYCWFVQWFMVASTADVSRMFAGADLLAFTYQVCPLQLVVATIRDASNVSTGHYQQSQGMNVSTAPSSVIDVH